jgi:flagellin
MRINQNVMANNASRNLSNTNVQLGKSLEKLSSGFRINRAADDAAGLVISQGLRAQVSGLKQATRNAQDGISVVQTAEGALNEVHTMLGRMRDLAVQAANTGGNDTASRGAAQAEIDQLALEITRTSTDTKFGGVSLLDGTYGVTGASLTGTATAATFSNAAGGVFTINIAGAGATTVNLGVHASSTPATAASDLQTAINAGLATSGTAAQQAFAGKVTVSSVAVGSNFALKIDVAGLTNAQTFVLADGANTPLSSFGLTGAVTAAVGTGGKFQIGANSGQAVSLVIGNSSAGTLGVSSLNVTTDTGAAAAIRFESMINNLQVSTENISASESRIRDTDMAQEMVSFTKNNVLMQAGTAMLSQANQIPQSILSLLR